MRGLTDAQREFFAGAARGESFDAVIALVPLEDQADCIERSRPFGGCTFANGQFMFRVDAAARAAGLWPVKP